ncbi:uncharacterized protein PAC_10863 [Phialocephala subalpina]|uniref:2EXR domain-containing protein n=1 Tax=Phialocephala subalpina TaxID=576137 RepID=A0A1L7X7J2_9HELO|nr:uncharacterized protein PAC_10863 [Phialocephala subalpina]
MAERMPTSTACVRARPATHEPKFTKFPELPTELRLKIWAYASDVTRTLELEYCMVDRKFFTFQHIPSVLHTNRESRGVGLQHYHLSFGTDKCPPGTYFNPGKDIVYFGTRQYPDDIRFMMLYFFKTAADLEPRDQIQHITMAEDMWKVNNGHSPLYHPFPGVLRTWRLFGTFLTAFPHLKRLIFVGSPDGNVRSGEQVEDAWEDYNGVSLIPSDDEEKVMKNSNLCVLVYPHFVKDILPKTYPKLVFMKYGFAD